MTSIFSAKVTKFYNALINRINASISSHNTNASAHSFGNNGASKNVVTDSNGNLITENKQVIIDNLTTDNGTQALSAKQGKILNDRINFIVDTELPTAGDATLTQTITDGDTTHAPSADAVYDALAEINDTIGSSIALITGTTSPSEQLVERAE